MARIFITGSSDGLGSLAAQRFVNQGHKVVLHARNAQRAKDALAACPGAESVLIGDLSSMTETKKLAEDVNKAGAFDVIIHSAGVYRSSYQATEGVVGLISVNTMAPYILTCLVNPPKRLVYLSSGMHQNGDLKLKDITWTQRGEAGWNDSQAYSDSKLHNVLLAKAVARKWSDVWSNSMDPGWVPTKMGGPSAPGKIKASLETYELLSFGGTTKFSGKYFRPGAREGHPKDGTDDVDVQDKLLDICGEITGVKFPS